MWIWITETTKTYLILLHDAIDGQQVMAIQIQIHSSVGKRQARATDGPTGRYNSDAHGQGQNGARYGIRIRIFEYILKVLIHIARAKEKKARDRVGYELICSHQPLSTSKTIK
jgi:hypothetical protein